MPAFNVLNAGHPNVPAGSAAGTDGNCLCICYDCTCTCDCTCVCFCDCETKAGLFGLDDQEGSLITSLDTNIGSRYSTTSSLEVSGGGIAVLPRIVS
jgi:hypothetical protein